MKFRLLTLGLVSLFTFFIGGKEIVNNPTTAPAPGREGQPAGPLDFTVKTIDGKEQKLGDYRGSVVMIVNVASKCGFTPQYKQLQAIYEKYKGQGLVVLGFPANNFKGQEPGSNEEIQNFCNTKYNVSFPLMAKISVKGDDQAPLYQFLTAPGTAGDFAGEIQWNFQKFIIDRHGNVIARFDPMTRPDADRVIAVIEKALAAK